MKNSLSIKSLLLIGFLFIILYSCEDEGAVPRLPVDKKGDNPDQISWNFNVTFYDSSRVKAKLQGRRARIYEQKRETLLDTNIRVEFMSLSSGSRVSLLTADSARIDDQTHDMIAKGKVFVISDSNQTTLETTYLEWDNETQKLRSSEYVKIISPYETIEGYGFESDQNLTNYRIYKVSGEQK